MGEQPRTQPVRITAEDARPVRHRVLRPGQPVDRLVYPGDDAPTTLHLGVRLGDGELVAVASFYHEPMPGLDAHAIRLRGMATLPEHRAQGHGRRLVKHAIAEIARTHGEPPTALWCNARISAAGYYERLGFRCRGDLFDIPDIGPHAVMVLDRSESAATTTSGTE